MKFKRIRGRKRVKLEWTIGRKDYLEYNGVIPVHFSMKNDLIKKDEIKEINLISYANSHKQNLGQHLIGVGNLSKIIIEYFTGNKNLGKLGYYAGIFHDIGKLDPNFQDFLLKTKDSDFSNGVHIEKPQKFSFEVYPRHNEISLLIFSFIDGLRLNKNQKDLIKHLIYFHHAKPIRKVEFKDLEDMKIKLEKGLKNKKINFKDLLDNSLKYIRGIKGFENIKTSEESFKNNINFPEYKKYYLDIDSVIDSNINLNAQYNILRSSLISADRIISSLESFELDDIYDDVDSLTDLFLSNVKNNSNLTKEINLMSLRFKENYPDSLRNKAQENLINELSLDDAPVKVVAGPAGVGKTKIFLEWAARNNAESLFIICPRVQVAQSLYSEIKSDKYLEGSSIEIRTGEINDGENNKESFCSDIVITTIDQIINIVNKHNKINLFTKFLNSHVVFDEFHEYIYQPGINIMFLELIKSKQLLEESISGTLLVSATPNPTFLKKTLEIDSIYSIKTFNESNYSLDFLAKNSNIMSEPFKNNNSGALFIFNTAKYAQKTYIKNANDENSCLFHSKYTPEDKSRIFNKIISNFGENGSFELNVLRSSPISQASLNISFPIVFSEKTSPDNFLQRLGRNGRFGEVDNPKFVLVISKDQDAFLKKMYMKDISNKWTDFIYENLNKDSFKLNEIYKLYSDFHESFEDDIFEEMKEVILLGVNKILNKVQDPVFYKSTKNKNKISSKSLRNDSRFVNMMEAEIDLNSLNLKDLKMLFNKNEDSTITLNVDALLGYGNSKQSHVNFMMKHHKRYDLNFKDPYKDNILLNQAKVPDSPIYLSYPKSIMEKDMGIPFSEGENFLYYLRTSKDIIGIMSLKNIKDLNNE